MDELLYLQVSEERMDEIRDVIVEILRDSGAKCGLLIDSSGHLLIRKGFTLLQEIDSLCVLIAASKATTQAIAQILGQQEMSVIFHQGSGDHIHCTDIGDLAILTLIFDDRVDLSELQAIAQRRGKDIEALLEPESANEETPVTGIEEFRDEADKRLQRLFAKDGPSREEHPRAAEA